MTSAAKPARTLARASSSPEKMEKFGARAVLVDIGLEILGGIIAAPFHAGENFGGG